MWSDPRSLIARWLTAGKMLLFLAYSPPCRQSPWCDWLVAREKCWFTFYGPLSKQSPWLDGLGVRSNLLNFLWSALQQFRGLNRMVYKGEMVLFFVYCPLPRQSPWLGISTVRGESVEFFMVFTPAIPWTSKIGWPVVDCKHSRSAVCLPAGFWGTLRCTVW